MAEYVPWRFRVTSYRALLVELIFLPLLGLTYIIVVADGFRTLLPVMGQRLHKLPIPFFRLLGEYEDFHKLDLAMFMALGVMICVWLSWLHIMKTFVFNEPTKLTRSDLVLRLLAGGLILGDSYLFFEGVRGGGWIGDAPFFPALVLTVVHVCVVVFVAYIVTSFKKENV